MANLQQAVALLDKGDLEQAYTLLLPLSRKGSDKAMALYYLGVLFHRRGDNQQALNWIKQAILQLPTEALFYRDLGVILKQLGRLAEAIAAYEQAIILQPFMVEARCNLGEALRMTGNVTGAIEHLTLAIGQAPQSTLAHYNLGVALLSNGDNQKAADSFSRVLSLDGNHFGALLNRGAALQALDDMGGALLHYQEAVRLQPDHPDAGRNLAHALLLCGEWASALDHYQRLLARHANDVTTAIHRLTALLYQPDLDNATLFTQHRRFAQRYARPAPATPPPARGEKLRLGYVCSHWNHHPVANNITPLIQHHDRQKFELFFYQDGGQTDHLTPWFHQQADHWRQIGGLSDQQAAQLMRQDQLHLLVILAGHFDGNRLLLAAQHAAPVCISYHDGTTSGLASMNYWLTDAILHPEDTTEQFSETLWRLPVFYSYPPPAQAPPVAPPPVLVNGFIRFGSFNNPAKVNDATLRVWGEILSQTPNSQLLLKYRSFFADSRLVERWRQRLLALGIDPQRVFFATGDRDANHLAQYSQMDIALDPFPFTGATTTFQALWMGVPVISLLGERFIQRMAGSILHHCGQQNLTATSTQEYVDKAVALAHDLPRLSQLRSTLRPTLLASPLCHGKGYALAVEEAFMAMYRAKPDPPPRGIFPVEFPAGNGVLCGGRGGLSSGSAGE